MNVRISSIYIHDDSPSQPSLVSCVQVDYGAQGLLAYAVHPGGMPTHMGLRTPSDSHAILTDTPGLSGDSIAFLTRERREWFAGRYISCEYLSLCFRIFLRRPGVFIVEY